MPATTVQLKPGAGDRPLRLALALQTALDAVFGAPGRPLRIVDPGQVERVRATPGWRFLELDTGHDMMLTAPSALSQVLLGC